ncbi:MAG: hypothetical protein ACT4OL_01090 [Nitrospiraceae bacterium]
MIRPLVTTVSAIGISLLLGTMSGCAVQALSAAIAAVNAVDASGKLWSHSGQLSGYFATGSNATALRSIFKSIKLGQFLGDQRTVSCRLYQISPQGSATFASYIPYAFDKELTIAEVNPSEGQMELNGTLKNVDVSCGVFSASWTIEMELSVGTQPPFTVKTVRSFDSALDGNRMVLRAFDSFWPTVRDFMNDVLTNPAFISFRKSDASRFTNDTAN